MSTYADLEMRGLSARIRVQVYRAIQQGILTRQPCEVCGAERVEAHHDDYSRPLDVRWLCRLHHAGLHDDEKPITARDRLGARGVTS